MEPGPDIEVTPQEPLALHALVRSRNPAEVRKRIASGADVNSADRFGRSALVLAAESNQCEVVELLLEAGVNPNAADHSGVTALMVAAGRQDRVIVESLLRAGAHPGFKDVSGHTALWHASRRIVDFTVPLFPGRHGTVFLPRLFETAVMKALRRAERTSGARL